MEEESAPRGGIEGVVKLPSAAPAFFVILTPSQGDSSKEEGILVANRDVSSVAPVITTGSDKSKSDFFLSSNCTSGEITVTLDNNNMWNEFYRCNTEMVLTKQGRRMFPYCRYWISGLNPYLKYILVMDITPLDNQRYKWNGKWWEPAGKADPHVLGRVFIHPESPSTGQYWMHQPVSFYKLKLTNNILDQEGHIILHSMHRYLPRLHVVPAEKSPEVIQLNGPDVHTFTFPQTEFIAVTAYQNFQITQLKIDCNPFAKGFREGTVPGRPVKDLKHKPSEQEVDASSSKNVEENEDPDRMKKLQELFKMSEYLDGDKENDIFNSVRDFLKLTKSTPVLDKDTKPNEDDLKRFAEHSSVASLSKPAEQLSVEVKKEPEDDYDYSKTSAIEGVAVKQEQSDAEDADVDYPILEKHFAKFKEDPYLDRNHSSDSPTGVAKAKLLELDQGSMCLEPCAADNNLEAPDLPKPVLPEDTLQDMDVQDSALRTESPPICPSPSVNSQVGVDVSVKEKRKRICKNKIDEIYATLQTALRTSRGPKRKCPLLFPNPPVTPTPGNEGTVAPIAKKRGRPPKPKFSKVGRPAKKDNPIEAPRLFPDFNPDLEDVDGVLFVAFSSKEALDVHMGSKPPDTEPSSLSTSEANTELTEEMQKILRLETQLLTHLKTMKNRQVIHPALQQVGLKLNIVDPAMSIDLRYLGVELPLLSITSDTNYDDNGLCAQGWPFVSRTGKTTDYTKIKGWRDKFSTEPATSSHKNEAGRKNLSAFCSDELDEYLENEAKLMGDLKELTWHKPESSVSYQLPTKSSSYVRTLDSVLKKQAQQAMSSLNATEQLPVPRKKRKYTRRVSAPKPDPKARPIIPASVTVKEKSAKPHSVQKKDHSASHFLNKVPSTPSSSVECLSKSQPVLKPSEDEQSGTVQHNLVASGEGNVFLNLQTQQTIKPIGFSKAQMKLLELEECAMWEGKPRTYITKERADVSLSTLLTAQASLRNKPIQKLINKRTDLCNKDFCRLGCICPSLSLTKHTATHCRHETCMFSCDCLKDGLKDETTQNKSETAFSPVPGYGYQPVQAEQTVKSPEAGQTEEHQEMTVDGSGKAKKRKFNEGNDRKSDVRSPVPFPIWIRSDVADDPEPLCIPEQAEFVEPRILHKEHAVKGRSPGGGKVGRPSFVAHIRPEDPMYLYSYSMKTCARVRAYQRKAPEEKKMKDQSICVKEHNPKSSKTRGQEKDANKEGEIIEKKCNTMNSNGPSKLIDIISDCSREKDDSKVLKITSQSMTRREPQSFKVGSFNIELKQENGIGETSASDTFCSRVKIAVSAEKQLNSDPPNPRPVKWQAENPSEEPEDAPADIEAKSHGGKGLPFYTKVIPAGKLVAHLKSSDVNQAPLVEVNGKNHPQAKLLLGQMGALHPANRLAAYVTHRLQPNLSHLSKVNEVSAKMATKSSSSDVITEDKSKDILPSQQNKTEIVGKKCDTMNNDGPSKLIDIISDCSREEDDSKVLQITSQRMTRREPQSFKVGSFNIELKQENGIGETSTSDTFCSRVKIAVSAEKQLNSDPPNPRPVKWQAENPSEEPEDAPADIEAKSHGGKGLPFYTKVIPAGKLVAHLKSSDINQAPLVEVNGKNHPQAKLLLGQMGALHPANRLAAYVTHRLQPNLSHLSKVKEVSDKMATKSSSSDVITEDKSKDILPSQQNKTAAQSRPSSTLTQFVTGDDGSVQKSPGVSSSEPTILGSPKLSIQSTRLIFVSSTVAAGKQAPAITTTSSSMNLPSLSTIPLSSAGLSTVSPSRKKATPSLPTLMRVTKLITKGSSLSIPAGIVAATDARAMTLTTVPSTKDTVLTPPVLSSPLVKSSPTTGNRSSVSPSNNSGINKSIATSLPSLVLSPNVPRVGSVASQVGSNITSPVTVKTVSTSTVPALNPSKVTSGPGKRLGPRLLLIPVNSSSSPARPVQSVQSSPGQKMVLQPIKTTSGVTLFRHPNGQIIQLVPLQQVQSSNVQPSRQQVIIRNPGPVMGIRLPLLTKSEASASVSIPATTVPPASPSSNSPVLSPSKTSPKKSGTAIFPQNPPMLSQLGSLAAKASPPKTNCETSLSFPKVVTYTGSEHAVITSNVMPLLSAGLSLPNVPPPLLQNNSPTNAATKPNLTLMGNKPGTTSNPNEEDKKLSDSSSPLKYGSSGDKCDTEVVKECEGQPPPEIVNDGNGPEVQKSTNQQIESVTEEVDTIAKEEQCQNGQKDNGHWQLSINSTNELCASDVDLLQEPRKKDAQGVLMRRDQGPADNGESQQCIADNTNSQEKIGDSSPVTFASAEHVAAGVEQNILSQTGEKAELSIEQKSAKSQDSVSSSNPNNCESLRVDPQAKKVSKWIDSKEMISDNQEIQSNLQTEEESDIDSVDIETMEELSDEIAGAKEYAAVTLKNKCGTPGKVFENDSKSEVDEYVDIETVEALSEKINLAHLKESAYLNKDMCDTQGKSSKGQKMTGEDIFSEALGEGSNIFHRKNHTANERKRRSKLRDLFEELSNALGLHNLPKVSKSFILKQAIEEIEDLTDTADTLIKKKTLLSQTQTQLIKKVSNLSGKPREGVLKNLEYLYEKQKAVETEQQKKNLEEVVAFDKAPMNLPPPLKLQEETNETLSGKTKKPIILARKALLLPKEGNQLQPGVPLTTSNVLMAPRGQVGKQEHGVAGQVAVVPPTLIQADLSPVQIQSGMASVVIQLPSAIKLKGIIGNNPVPIALSTVPGNISTASSFGPVSDEDDLSMMPKIVNVMSLALGAKSDMGMEIGISGTEKEWKSDACSLTTEAYAGGNAPAPDARYVTAESCVPSTSVPVDKTKEVVADPARKSCSPYSSLHENLPQEIDSGNTEASLKTEDVSVSITPPIETVDVTRGTKLDLELKKLTSAIDEAGLDPTELPDTMGDPEEADETLTSLLNEIAFLNQQLNNDADALESVSDFPGPDTVSHSDVSKFADADSSPFSFSRFKDGPETKEKNISFSPLLMQLEEGEIPDSSKLNEGAGIAVFSGKEPPLTEVAGTSIGRCQPPAIAPTHQRTDQSVGLCSDVFWRPMPKLAPLGLKSYTLPSDQSVLASKPMPSLASVALRLSSPKTTD